MMKKNTKTGKSERSELVSSILYTQGSEEINKLVEDELKVPDPSGDEAASLIIESNKQ